MAEERNLKIILNHAIETIDNGTRKGFAQSNPDLLGTVVAAMIHYDAAIELSKAMKLSATLIANAGLE